MPINPLSLGGLADRLLNRLDSLFGHDRELDQLSNEITDLKKSAYSDNQLSEKDLSAIHARMADVEARYAKYAASRSASASVSAQIAPAATRARGASR